MPQVVAWLLGALAQAVPAVVARLLGRREARDAVEDELLLRLLDTTEGTYADAYEVAAAGVPASVVAATVIRMARRGLLERHPDAGWVLSDRGRAAAMTIRDNLHGGAVR